MPGNYSKLVTVTTGQVITAAERNNEHDNHITNATPTGIDDYSGNTTEMRDTADPYPAGSESLATSLKEEIKRLRYQWLQLTGGTYWYEDPIVFHDRGDQAVGDDYDDGDLTIDSTWRDLDLSSFAGAGTRAFLLDVYVQYTGSLTNNVINFRENGNANANNAAVVTVQASGRTANGRFLVACDTNRIIEYNGTGPFDSGYPKIRVAGWFR